MTDAITAAVVFFAIYHIIKMFTEYLLKRRIVKSGHIDKAGILEPASPLASPEIEPRRFVTLKWAIVSTMAGLGLVAIELFGRYYDMDTYRLNNAPISLGAELVFIGLGFIIYFVIVSRYQSEK